MPILTTVGIGRFALDLPCDVAAAEAVERAAAALRDHGIRAWTQLELQTTLPTAGDPGTCKFTFTYWHEE